MPAARVNGKSNVTQLNAAGGGVLLGGRELRLTLDRVHEERLKAVAKSAGMTPRELASAWLEAAVDNGFTQMSRARFVYLLTVWIAWT